MHPINDTRILQLQNEKEVAETSALGNLIWLGATWCNCLRTPSARETASSSKLTSNNFPTPTSKDVIDPISYRSRRDRRFRSFAKVPRASSYRPRVFIKSLGLLLKPTRTPKTTGLPLQSRYSTYWSIFDLIVRTQDIIKLESQEQTRGIEAVSPGLTRSRDVPSRAPC